MNLEKEIEKRLSTFDLFVKNKLGSLFGVLLMVVTVIYGAKHIDDIDIEQNLYWMITSGIIIVNGLILFSFLYHRYVIRPKERRIGEEILSEIYFHKPEKQKENKNKDLKKSVSSWKYRA